MSSRPLANLTGGLIGGQTDAGRQASDASKMQNQWAQQMMGTYRDVLPLYMQGLDQLSQFAGLGNFHPSDFGTYAPGTGHPQGPSAPSPYGGQALQMAPMSPPPSQPQAQWIWNPPSGLPPAPQVSGAAHGNSLFEQSLHGKGDAVSDTMGDTGEGDPIDNLQVLWDDSPCRPRKMAPPGKGDPIPQVNPPQMQPANPNPYPAPTQPSSAPTTPQAAPPSPSVPSQAPSPFWHPATAQQPRIDRAAQLRQQTGIGNNGAFNVGKNATQEQQHQTATLGMGITQPWNTATPQAGQNGTGGPQNPWMQGQTGGISNSQLGPYQSQAYALQNAQAQDAINHQNYLAQQNLKSQLASRGLEDSGMLAGGLTQLQNAANNEYANFRQNLGISIPQQQMQNVLQMLQALGPGLGMSGQAQSGLGSAQQSAFQQQQNQQQALQNAFQAAGQFYGMGGLGRGGYGDPNDNWFLQ